MTIRDILEPLASGWRGWTIDQLDGTSFIKGEMETIEETIAEAEQAIQALISDQVAKARIDELIGVRGWTEYEPDPKYSPAERFHIVPYTYLTNRIAELNGVKE